MKPTRVNQQFRNALAAAKAKNLKMAQDYENRKVTGESVKDIVERNGVTRARLYQVVKALRKKRGA